MELTTKEELHEEIEGVELLTFCLHGNIATILLIY